MKNKLKLFDEHSKCVKCGQTDGHSKKFNLFSFGTEIEEGETITRKCICGYIWHEKPLDSEEI